MMRNVSVLLVYCLVAPFAFQALTACAQSNEAQNRVEVGLIGSVAIPASAALEKDPNNMPDFSVYHVRKGSHALVGIYLGGWPDYPSDVSAQSTTLGSCAAKVVTRVERGATSRDYLVKFKEVPGFPQLAHFYFRAASAEDVEQAERVIRSFRVSETDACE